MLIVYLIMLAMLLADLFWWWVADRNARLLRSPAYRWFVHIFMGFTVLGLLLLILARLGKMRAMIMPEIAVEVIFIWHFIVMPIFTVPGLIVALVSGLRSIFKPKMRDTTPVDSSRRAFLAQAIAFAPPVIAMGLTAKAVIDQDDLIITRTNLLFSQLPQELEGTTIAFVADPHIGSFMSDRKYKKIIELTNELDADLVLHGGDLINSSLGDLPDGIQMLSKFRARRAVYSTQGNHDCIEDRDIFERETRIAEVGMLLNESRTLSINGKKLQIISPKWVGRMDNSSDLTVRNILSMRDPDAFQILLAHHPHCFDEAARNQIPLMLAGHTHGGQVALTKNIGFGPLAYRYWSGIYQKNNSTCLVSNGVGNWFPLRINMPCEIVHITLHRA